MTTVTADKPEREEKPVSELERGTWVELIDQDGDYLGEGRVLYVETYEEESLGRRALLIYQLPGWNPDTLRCDADMTLPLLSGDEVKEREASAERDQKIAEIRALADWLEANPWLPLVDLDVNRHLRGIDGYRTVVETAKRLGATLDKHLDDRTKFRFTKGPMDYTLLVWHEGGRPAEPAPEPVAEDLVDETEPVTAGCVFKGDPGFCATHKVSHKPIATAECGCPVYPFRQGRGDAADTIVDHRPSTCTAEPVTEAR